jgi:hypothetical protein
LETRAVTSTNYRSVPDQVKVNRRRKDVLVTTKYEGDSELMATDGETLLNFLMPDAIEDLEKNQEVLPRAAVVTEGGELRMIEAPDDPEAAPQEAFEALCDQIRRGSYRSAGLCFDIHFVREDVDHHSDGIRVYLETKDGAAMNVFLPYEHPEGGEVKTGELFATEGKARIFGEDAEA